MTIKGRKGDTVVEVDEAPRRDSSLEALAKLPGLHGKEGSHTAGNSPGVNDGAGALVVASDEWAERNGKEALATIVAQAAVADDFPYLARTPANAAKKALEKAGLQPDDIDLWEINEAFASVTLNSIRMLGIDEDTGQRQRRRGRHRPPDRRLGRAHPRHAGARAAPPRRRLRLRGDLLGRRPGRRRDRQGLTERPHILPPPPGGGALRRPDEPGAAFFDLDRTLMAGSSAFQFGRAAYKAGLVNRRALARDAWENLLFRLRGSTDEGTDALRERIGAAARGRPRARPAAAGAGRARRRAAAAVPADARDRLRAPGRRAARSSSAPPPRRRWPS